MISGYSIEVPVTPAAASAKSGIPAANIVAAVEIPDGLLMVTTANTATVDAAADALPCQLVRGV